VWELGAVDGPPATLWSRIVDATILNGYVYAADINLPTVRRIALDGTYMGELGGAGQGPGEFVRPLSLFAQGDSLVVYDLAQKRSSVFDSQGAHLQTFRAPVPRALNFFGRIWPARFGWWVGETYIVGRRNPAESVTQMFTVAWQDFDERADTLHANEGNPFWVRYRLEDSLTVVTTNTLGADGGSWVVGDSLVVLVDGVGMKLSATRITPSGLVESIEHVLPGASVPLTADDRDAAIRWLNWKFDVDPGESPPAEVVVPDRWSAWTSVHGDEAGKMWLRKGGPSHVNPESGERWVRWSLDAGYAGEIQLPAGVEALRFREGHLVAMRKGEFGIPYLLLFEVVEE
jgi:hypothetical protein